MIGRLPNESPEYRKVRDELVAAEIALRDQRESVAELRRRLPLDREVPDAVFREAPLEDGDPPVSEVRLSQLFDAPERPLILMHFMFGKAQKEACPMCTMWADGYDGVVPHVQRRASFGVLVAGDAGEFRRHARRRGWRNLRLLSAADSTLKRDLGFEGEKGEQNPGVSVFVQRDGRIFHFYSVSAYLAEGEFRGMDLLCPTWHFLDLLPNGRGSFIPRI